MNGEQWVELLVREIKCAANMDEARNCASRTLMSFEQFICVHATSEAPRELQQENIILKEQSKALIQENNILKQMVSQYPEQLSLLEVNNYALRMHLQQAQQSNPISGRFHPDVF